jgi:hypothetical protein
MPERGCVEDQPQLSEFSSDSAYLTRLRLVFLQTPTTIPRLAGPAP